MIEDETRIAAALPGYELGARLGRGGSGVVLAGRDQELNRDVAIKIMPVGHEGAIERSRAEGRFLALLDHPHIVRVYRAVATDDAYLIVMEMMSGGALTRRRKGLTQQSACAIGLAVAAALAHAHSVNVLHRDIKPGNILFDATGLPKVADFSVAKAMAGSTSTATARMIGTFRYMAPEQFLGGRLRTSTDLYALGVLLHELLTGSPLFGRGLSDPALMHHHLQVPAPHPVGVPAPLAAVVMPALAKEPAARPSSAHAFALDLARAATAAFGPGWTDGTGITLRLDRDIQAAVDRPLPRVPRAGPAAVDLHPGPGTATPKPGPGATDTDTDTDTGATNTDLTPPGELVAATPRPGRSATGAAGLLLSLREPGTPPERRPADNSNAQDTDPRANVSDGDGGGPEQDHGEREQPARTSRVRSRLASLAGIGLAALVVTTVIITAITVALLVSPSGSADPGATARDGDGVGAAGPRAAATASQSAEQAWHTLLDRLNAARSRAFERADVALLAEANAPGSPQMAADQEVIRGLAANAVRTSSLRIDIRELSVRSATAEVANLRIRYVTEPYEFLDAAAAVREQVPRGPEQIGMLTLRRTGAGWRIAELAPTS